MNTRIYTHTMKKYSVFFFFFLFIFISCGIEDYVYLDPIPAGNINERLGETATISLPNSSSQSIYFTHYSIFYRIYLSNQIIAGSISEGNLSGINSTLNSDYFAIKPYTNVASGDTNISPSNIANIFANRNYNRIAVEGTSIETLLNNTSDGKLMTLDFTVRGTYDNNPILTLDSVPYQLRRSLDAGNFSPKPDGDYAFKNNSEIRDSNNIQDFNKDVANAANATECYISLYILKEGIETSGFTRIYSFPTFIGIFRLPS